MFGGLLVVFNGISTIVGYKMSNVFIHMILSKDFVDNIFKPSRTPLFTYR